MIDSALKTRTIELYVLMNGRAKSDNDDATIVIEQGGKFAQPVTRVDMQHSSAADWFYQRAHAPFDEDVRYSSALGGRYRRRQCPDCIASVMPAL